ncbi:FmdB family regulatory protein OS=Rhodopirellula europaea 6C GN=RE6C_02103 PE=4 SV=1: Zn-ribbon_8 [Gemmataceae bacterium]|nr:FmdB family regulatory protein OS=Rhodopirellula europaea 6C GN=RE6C_02103 PE=4 SV=1: Zn-ribbon_8 [Gemmataceae bacterium]VTU01737.1 FmdB family regulatory protein OS=Rhodopirellula europaea 6C GN=RE6C_02103 PE=4 SV=1: Zn-ribbon_8 [Gemmataceae bacterium]
MPTYDYECSACGHRFDELQSFNDPVLTKCPKCKKNKLERLFGGGGAIIFKGGGFYETDYRRAGQKADAGESKPEAKADTKADAAPAAPASPPPPPAPAAKADGGGGSKKAK